MSTGEASWQYPPRSVVRSWRRVEMSRVCPSPECVETRGKSVRTIVDDELRLADGEKTGRLVQSAPGWSSGRARAAAAQNPKQNPQGAIMSDRGKASGAMRNTSKALTECALQGRFQD
jgi:hypothetical protein